MTRCAECILGDVSRSFGISVADIRSPSKKSGVVRARFAAMRMLRRERSLSYPQIARLVGRTDHVCAILGIRRADGMIIDDADFASRYEGARL